MYVNAIIHKIFFVLISLCMTHGLWSQFTIKGIVTDCEKALPFASIAIADSNIGILSDSLGYFQLNDIPEGKHILHVSHLGFESQMIELSNGPQYKNSNLEICLKPNQNILDEVVVTGTMKPISRLDSPVPVELYSPAFFDKNPTGNIFEGLQNVNGVRPQINCNVCNTGDIHINGLEGPYTMVLLDGMPIVSSLASVYGLSGIPNSIIDRVEIVKGPASSLYGSEAIGGLINIITKKPQGEKLISVDVMSNSWQEHNLNLGLSLPVSDKVNLLTGLNIFNYTNPIDNNRDNFTDVTLQRRVSLFQKWNFVRADNKLSSLAARYYYENRWGGQMQWEETYRASSEIYGEAIDTRRFELIAEYQLPFKENILASFSFNTHHQDSAYGDLLYVADQKIAFGQLTWNKKIQNHDLLFGSSVRYTFYDDNTPATELRDGQTINMPDKIWLPGVFVQDEITLDNHTILLGSRYDYNNRHGHIFTPRFALKLQLSDWDRLRINAGTGFRIVNIFTEDHAALTGAREVLITEDLKPERSINVNLNYSRKIYNKNLSNLFFEFSAWYTRFSNAIIPDYETDITKIIYNNLNGHAVSKGISMNLEYEMPDSWNILGGISLLDVSLTENNISERQLLTERFTFNWAISKSLLKNKLSLDYTGKLYSPMRLPLLGELDPRDAFSPWWSIQNIQCTYKINSDLELYSGLKIYSIGHHGSPLIFQSLPEQKTHLIKMLNLTDREISSPPKQIPMPSALILLTSMHPIKA